MRSYNSVSKLSLWNWDGVQGIIGGVRAARGGHDVIMSPTSHCYFDYKQSIK